VILSRLVCDPERRAQKCRAKLGDKFFEGVLLVSKALAELPAQRTVGRFRDCLQSRFRPAVGVISDLAAVVDPLLVLFEKPETQAVIEDQHNSVGRALPFRDTDYRDLFRSVAVAK